MPNTAPPQGPSLAAHSPLNPNPSGTTIAQSPSATSANKAPFPAGPPAYSQPMPQTGPPMPNTQQPLPPGQAYAYPPPTQTTVVLQPGLMIQGPGMMFSPDPAIMQCPSCKQNIVTRVTFVNGLFTYLMCVLICCCTLCIDAFKDAVHSCPNCGAFIGTYRRL